MPETSLSLSLVNTDVRFVNYSNHLSGRLLHPLERSLDLYIPIWPIQSDNLIEIEIKEQSDLPVMALGRLVLKNLQQRLVSTSPSPLSQSVSERALNAVQKQRWGSELLWSLSSAGDGEGKQEGREVSVSEGRKLFPWRRRRGSLWKKNTEVFPPPLWGKLQKDISLFLSK